MIHSAVVSFPCCGLRWVLDLVALAELQGLDLDKAPPPPLQSIVLGCTDGRHQPVPPRYFTKLLEGSNSRTLILDAAARALVGGLKRITSPPTGEVTADPELEMDAAAALEKYLAVNGVVKL